MGRLAQNSTSRKSNTILYHLFYPRFFVLELLMYISNTYTKSHYDIELGMDPLLYFCVIYFHETYIFMRFIEQKQVYMVLQYYYILELTTIFSDDIDIQGDSLPESIG